jgi:hypothetical protein
MVSRHPIGGDPNHANSPARFAPRCTRYRVVQPVQGADTCESSCQSNEPHCIKLVTPEMVVAAAHELLHQDYRAAMIYELRKVREDKAAIHLATRPTVLGAARLR